MEKPVREMTLQEEIEALDIEEGVKQRLLSKLEDKDCRYKAKLDEQADRMYSEIRNLEERNKALLNACESLCRAMTILGRNKNV